VAANGKMNNRNKREEQNIEKQTDDGKKHTR
jgi:hypothetical protein